MLTWIIQISIISIIFIFLVHHLLLFFKSTLTVPKIKDLVNSPTQKYQNIYDTICNKNNSYSTIDLLPLSNYTSSDYTSSDYVPSDYTSSDNIPSDYIPSDDLNSFKKKSMKDELKNFLKKQLNNESDKSGSIERLF
jgi:hypothetical protein